jgi:hypothetical protein
MKNWSPVVRAKLLKISPVNSMVYECFICRYTHTWFINQQNNVIGKNIIQQTKEK